MKQETKPQDTSTRKDELGITKGEWVVEPFGKTFQIMSGDIGERSHIATLFTATMDNSQQQPSNAKAICTAVNSTYGKGYNPAAMEELYKALQQAKTDLYNLGNGINGKRTAIEMQASIDTALTNAKTIKP